MKHVSKNEYRAQFVANRESYLMLKTNYHPGWDVTLDDKKVAPVMLAPGFIGIKVDSGNSSGCLFVPTTFLSTPLVCSGRSRPCNSGFLSVENFS